MVDDRAVGIIHVSQLASLIGIGGATAVDERRQAWDLAAMLRIWVRIVGLLDWPTMLAATPSRGRSVRELVVNVFEMIRPLQDAWAGDDFVIDVPSERPVAESLDAPGLTRYMEGIASQWEAFVVAHEIDERPSAVPVWRTIESGERRPLGELPFGGILSFVANHTAGHLRQTTVFLDRRGIGHAPDRLEQFDVQLAADPFDDAAAPAPFAP